MKKCLTIFFLLNVLLLSFNMVSSVSPFIDTTNPNNLQIIRGGAFEAIPTNNNISISFHVFNATTLLTNNTATCSLHFANNLDEPIGAHFYRNSNVAPAFPGAREYEDIILAGNFTRAGEYCINIECNTSTQTGGIATCFEVTENGKPSPEGIVILGFIIALMALFIFLTTYLVRAVGLLVEASFDIMDIAYAWGLYFGLLGLNQLAIIYLGSLAVNNWLSLFVKIFAFPFVILPVLAFFISMFVQKKRAREKKAEW